MKDINEQQNIQIAELKKDICWLKKSLQKIEKQVFNELPHQIEGLDKKIDSILTKLFYGFIVMISATLILQIILKFF